AARSGQSVAPAAHPPSPTPPPTAPLAPPSVVLTWHALARSPCEGYCSNYDCRIKPGDDNGSVIARLADLQERIGTVEGRVRKLREQIHAVHHQLLDDDEAALAMSIFDPVWGSLTPHEQVRVVHLLVEQVDYDGSKGKVAIAFRPAGIETLARELADKREEKRA